MTDPHDDEVLAALRAAATSRRAVRRLVADAAAQYGARAAETMLLRAELRVVIAIWAGRIRAAAAAGYPLATVARAAGVAAPSLYYRLRTPAGG